MSSFAQSMFEVLSYRYALIFETGQITGIVLVDLLTAYDTVNHRRLLEKVYNMTRDYLPPDVHDSHSTGEPSFLRGTRRENKQMAISVERPTARECPRTTSLQRIHKRQPIHPGTRSFVCADDLAVTTHSTEFAPIEETLTSTVDGLSEYCTTNQLRANPTKTQVSLFHLRNRECGKQLIISWNGMNLIHCNLPVILASH